MFKVYSYAKFYRYANITYLHSFQNWVHLVELHFVARRVDCEPIFSFASRSMLLYTDLYGIYISSPRRALFTSLSHQRENLRNINSSARCKAKLQHIKRIAYLSVSIFYRDYSLRLHTKSGRVYVYCHSWDVLENSWDVLRSFSSIAS